MSYKKPRTIILLITLLTFTIPASLLTGCASHSSNVAEITADPLSKDRSGSTATSPDTLTDTDTLGSTATSPDTLTGTDTRASATISKNLLNSPDSLIFAGISSSPLSGLISSRSSYKTSFLETLGRKPDVLYLGKPRDLGIPASASDIWHSSDESIALVRNGVVIGLKEGVAAITLSRDGKTVNEWEFAVTTFNDGRQAELSYSLGKEKIAEMLAPENGVPSPYYLKQNINTLQDAITYFQLCGFEKKDELPILGNEVSDWLWFVPGDTVLLENLGYPDDLAAAADYLLDDDFEDHGLIYTFGTFYKTISWFYEDGYYYAFYFRNLTSDFTNDIRDASYEIFRTDNLENLKQYALDVSGTDSVMAVIMISFSGHGFRPPMRLSYLHDSSVIYHEHVEIGFEDAVLNSSKILYTNPDFDLEIVGIPAEDIPAGIPRYGQDNCYKY